jgi:hypothetical protein
MTPDLHDLLRQVLVGIKDVLAGMEQQQLLRHLTIPELAQRMGQSERVVRSLLRLNRIEIHKPSVRGAVECITIQDAAKLDRSLRHCRERHAQEDARKAEAKAAREARKAAKSARTEGEARA